MNGTVRRYILIHYLNNWLKKKKQQYQKKKSLKIQKIWTTHFSWSVIQLLFLPHSSCSKHCFVSKQAWILQSTLFILLGQLLQFICFQWEALDRDYKAEEEKMPFFLSVSDGNFSSSSSNPCAFQLVGSCNTSHPGSHKRTTMVLMAVLVL